jgi:hypothetical protein
MMKVQLKLSGKRTTVTYELDDALLVPLSNILSRLETDGDIASIETHYVNNNKWAITPVRNTGYKPRRLAKGIY